MKEKELQELERALQAATPAPWRATLQHDSETWSYLKAHADKAPFCGARTPDAAAIVLLRNAAPPLLADLREARALIWEIGLRLPSLCEYKCSRMGFHTPTCLRGKINALGNAAPKETPPAPPEDAEERK